MGVFKAISSYSVSGTFSNPLDHSIPTSRIGVNLLKQYTSGTGANQANQWWADRRTTPAGAESLDLFGGLTDAFGNTINFATIREIIVQSRSTTTAERLSLSGTAFSDMGLITLLSIGAGGRFMLSSPIDGFAITDSSGDILTVTPTPSNGSHVYDIFLIGTV